MELHEYEDNQTMNGFTQIENSIGLFGLVGLFICSSYSVGKIWTMIHNSCNKYQRNYNSFKIDSLLTHSYSPLDECSICLDLLQGEVVTLCCQHSYHKKCVTDWISAHNTCPLCRKSVISDNN